MIKALYKALCVGTAMVASAASALAAYPDKAINLIVPFPAASPNDKLARYIAPKLEKELGQTVIVLNKPGGGGTTGSTQVAKGAADGYNILLATTSPMVVSPASRKNYPFDPVKDLVPLYGLRSDGLAIVVNAGLKATTLKELVEYGKANPGKLTFGTAGVGTSPHFTGELMQAVTGIDMVHIPYQGGPAGLNDLLAGNINIMFNPTQQAADAAATGKARVLAVVAQNRLAGLESVPTVAEAGFPLIASSPAPWFGFFVPAGTPSDIAAKLEAAIKKGFASDDFKAQARIIGIVGDPISADELKKRVSGDLAFYQKLARERNVSTAD